MFYPGSCCKGTWFARNDIYVSATYFTTTASCHQDITALNPVTAATAGTITTTTVRWTSRLGWPAHPPRSVISASLWRRCITSTALEPISNTCRVGYVVNLCTGQWIIESKFCYAENIRMCVCVLWNELEVLGSWFFLWWYSSPRQVKSKNVKMLPVTFIIIIIVYRPFSMLRPGWTFSPNFSPPISPWPRKWGWCSVVRKSRLAISQAFCIA